MTKQNSGPGGGERGQEGQAAPSLSSPGDGPADGVQWNRVSDVLAKVRPVWAVPLLRALDSGVSRPRDLPGAVGAEAVPGRRLSSKIMYETLELLVRNGLVRRTEVPGFPLETHYWPTQLGHEILAEVSKLGTAYPRRRPGMGQQDRAAPPGVNPDIPSPARIWNAFLGGKDNFESDRKAMRVVLEEMPSVAEAARLTRRFQADAVRRLAGLGVRQFLDIGTGLPVAGAVHEIAQGIEPASRVVYVDNDPMVAVHARALLTSSPEGACSYVDADLHEPGKVLARAAETLDFGEPVAVVLMMILHFLPDRDDPWAIVRRLMQGIRGDKYLVIAHVGADITPGPAAVAAERYNQRASVPVRIRSRDEVERFFTGAGLEMLAPGVVPIARWWPGEGEELPQDANAHVGIGWRDGQRSQAKG